MILELCLEEFIYASHPKIEIYLSKIRYHPYNDRMNLALISKIKIHGNGVISGKKNSHSWIIT